MFQPKPLSGMASPPILATVFGNAAMSAMSVFHRAKISSRCDAYGPTPMGVPKWSNTMVVPGVARAKSRNSRF